MFQNASCSAQLDALEPELSAHDLALGRVLAAALLFWICGLSPSLLLTTNLNQPQLWGEGVRSYQSIGTHPPSKSGGHGAIHKKNRLSCPLHGDFHNTRPHVNPNIQTLEEGSFWKSPNEASQTGRLRCSAAPGLLSEGPSRYPGCCGEDTGCPNPLISADPPEGSYIIKAYTTRLEIDSKGALT